MAFRFKACICLIIFAAVYSFAQMADQVATSNKAGSDIGGSLLAAVINRTITYQGILKNGSGTPVPNNTYNLTFRIYKQSTGGSALWTSSSTPVTTTGGLFAALLGPINLPFDTTYYVSIEVAGDAEMSRQMMTMSPYSASSDTANYAKVNGDNKWLFRITDVADTTLISRGQWGLARNGNVLWGTPIPPM
jgi:hypothetical protein